MKQVKIEKKSIDFWYVDESPSRDNISKHIELNGSYSIDLGFRFTGRKASIVNWAIEGHGYFGSLGGLDLELGTVFTSKIKDKSFRFEPELMIIGGYCQKELVKYKITTYTSKSIIQNLKITLMSVLNYKTITMALNPE
ncbi:MAG: hypothetical protein IPH36_20080 [Saprospiraceae bacterium]|nr:hypothetical protein [Saprospiraceae bacterium]